jgi:hypothetical protein
VCEGRAETAHEVSPQEAPSREPVEGSNEFLNSLEIESDGDIYFFEYDDLGDPVAESQKLTNWFKASYLRLDDLSDTIKEGL